MVAVEDTGPDVDAGIARFTVRRGKDLVRFCLSATDLGSWTSQVSRVRRDKPDVLADADEMLELVADHAIYVLKDGACAQSFEAVDDVRERTVGFRCLHTGREWWTGLTSLRTSSHARDMLTPEQRQSVGAHIGAWGFVPKPGEVVLP